jgi:hypothetical protein
MRLVAIIAGAVLLLAAARWNEGGSNLWPLLKGDFEPGKQGNFIAWFVAIVAIGALGYVPELKGISTLFLAIVIVVLIFSAIKKNPQLLQQAAQAVTQKAS